MVAGPIENHLDRKEGTIMTEEHIWVIYSKSEVKHINKFDFLGYFPKDWKNDCNPTSLFSS